MGKGHGSAVPGGLQSEWEGIGSLLPWVGEEGMLEYSAGDGFPGPSPIIP
jgi:hypothetical protein